MVDTATVRSLVLALPGASDDSASDALRFSVGGKGFAWTYMQRVAPRKPRVARSDVLAVRCPMERKDLLLAAAPEVFFDDDHYRDYPAVLVRLEAIEEADLAALLEAAHRLQSPRPGAKATGGLRSRAGRGS